MPLGAFKTAMLGAAGSGGANHFIGWWDWSAGASGQYRFNGSSNAAINSDGDVVVQAEFQRYVGGTPHYLPLLVYINEDTTVKWNKMLGTTSTNYQSKLSPSTARTGGVHFDGSGDVYAVVNGIAGQSGWSTDAGGLANIGPICFQKYSKTDGSMNDERIIYRAANYHVSKGSLGTVGTEGVWICGDNDNMYHTWGVDIDDLTSNYMLGSANSPNGGSHYIGGSGGYGDNWCAAGTMYRTVGVDTAYRPVIFTNGNSAFGFAYQVFHNNSSPGTNYYGMDIDMDTSGNKYVAMRHQNYTPGMTLKVTGHTSQSMSISWQQAYEGSYSSKWFMPYSIKADSSGNTYTVGYVEATVDSFGGKHGFIQKHNSSGTLQWENMFTPVHSGTGKESFLYCVDISDDEESIVVTGGLADNNNYQQLMVAKLPADGSGTGDYATGTNAGTIKYYDGSSHISSTSHNLSTNGMSISTGNHTGQANSATSVTSGAPDSDLGTYRTQSI